MLKSVENYAVVNCVKCSRKIKPKDQRVSERNIVSVKCKEGVICYHDKGCFSATARAVSGERTDEIVFSEVGKQVAESNLLCDFGHERGVGNRTEVFTIIFITLT